MISLANASLATKVTGAILATSLAVLVLGFVLIGVRDVAVFKREMERTTMLIAELVGEYSVVDLAFGDHVESGKSLAKMAAMPDIEAVTLYDGEGALFATYQRPDLDHEDPPPVQRMAPEMEIQSRSTDRHIEVYREVWYEGHRYGTIHLRATSEPLRAMIRAHILSGLTIATGLTLVAMAAAFLLQRAISGPILGLAAMARRLSDEADYSMRAPVTRGDEIGVLSIGFNTMLAAIERRQQERDAADGERREAQRELHQLNEELEERVARRTHELERAQVQLVQAAKMASLGTLMAGLAHEINNPVNYLSGNLVLLGGLHRRLRGHLHELSDALLRGKLERSGALLADSVEAANRLSELSKSLRLFSTPSDAPLQPGDLHQAIDASLQVLEPRLKDGIEVVKHYGELPAVPCKIGQLNQVFLNLIENAVEAMEGRGRLIVTTALESGSAVIRFADEGPGIVPEAISRLFDPFFTTKDVGKGMGMGLALSQTIVVDAHGGEISARNRPEGGCEFTIRLSCSLPRESEAQPNV